MDPQDHRSQRLARLCTEDGLRSRQERHRPDGAHEAAGLKSYERGDPANPVEVALTETTPLFVHPAGALRDRPDAQLRIPNLLLASDYVRTYTNLACMEGANEAARRAVLAILWREMASSSRFPRNLATERRRRVRSGPGAGPRALHQRKASAYHGHPEHCLQRLGDGVYQRRSDWEIDLLGLRGMVPTPTPMALPTNGVSLPRFSPK